MTKELSNQICEKCGLPFSVPFRYFKMKNPPFNTEAVEETTQRYLDFGQPENFVKLMELPFEDMTLGEFVSVHFARDRKTFLEDVIETLDTSLVAYRVKQSIREAEWKYE